MKNTFLSCSHNESQMYGSWSNLMKKLNMMSLYGEKDFSSTLATSTFSILVSNWAYSSNIPEKEKQKVQVPRMKCKFLHYFHLFIPNSKLFTFG